jgi:hypothetical protein
MRESGLSVDEVQVRDVYAMVDDERPTVDAAVFRVTFEWRPSHETAIKVLQRARELEMDHPLASPAEHPDVASDVG